ncbi:MAG: DoxX family protein [Chitinophagales bacterium]
MNIVLWILQGLLGVMFTMAGVFKATSPIEKMSEKMPWVKDFPAAVVRFIGVTQFLAGLGLILPWLTGIAPILTPLAAAGLCLTMVSAAVYHLRKGESKEAVVNVVLFMLAAVIVWGRW